MFNKSQPVTDNRVIKKMIKIIFQKNGYALANKINANGLKTWYCLDLTMSDVNDDSSYDILYSGTYEGACELYHTIKND